MKILVLITSLLVLTSTAEANTAEEVCEVVLYDSEGLLSVMETNSRGETAEDCAIARQIAQLLNERNMTGDDPVIAVVSHLN